MTEIWEKRLGFVSIDPDGPVVAGSLMEWTLTYTVGSYGVDEGGLIILAQRLACDMEIPQFDDPSASGFTKVSTTGNCRLKCRFERKRLGRPWMRWNLVIDVVDGFLSPGDKVTVILGDRSYGSPGIRAQSFKETHHEFRWLVDPTNAAIPTRLPSSPVFPIVAGKPVTLRCIVPSQLTVGETGTIFVKGEDVWGNPTPVPNGLTLSCRSTECAFIDKDRITAKSPGVVWVDASAAGMECKSNPLEIIEASRSYKPFWADLHGQTDNTVGTGSVEEYFDFAYQWARLDIACHQGNDFQVTDEDWHLLNTFIKSDKYEGQMVIFPGYEWSGNTPAGGDHNVLFLENDPPILRSSHWQVPAQEDSELTPAHPVSSLFDKLRSLESFNSIVIPHVGGRYADVRRYFDSELEPLVEILSCHGIFEWMLWDALEAGQKVGVVCNSDGHKGRPGAEGPGAGHFGVQGGLTCVLAKGLDRESVFESLKNRCCYGTTGCRMLLNFEAGGYPMGSEIRASDPLMIKAQVHGTSPIESLTIYKGSEPFRSIRPPEFKTLNKTKRLRIFWEGARIRGRDRRAVWDGEIMVEGAKIVTAQTFSFDSPAEGIIETSPQKVIYKSSTVGDRDGIELCLDQARSGTVSFLSSIGQFSVNLEHLQDEEDCFHFGGLGLIAGIRRHPEMLETKSLSIEQTVIPAATCEAFLVKAVQVDGNMAWSSPIFITGE